MPLVCYGCSNIFSCIGWCKARTEGNVECLYGMIHPPVFVLYGVLVNMALPGTGFRESWANVQGYDMLTVIIMMGIQWKTMRK